MVIGGAAVIAHGIPRFTADIDATILADDPQELMAAFQREGIVGRVPDVISFARKNRVLLLEHEASQIPIDLTLAALPFEAEALSHREVVRFGRIDVPVPRVEDLVIYKLVAARPRDLDDIERLLELHRAVVDLGRVRRIVREFALALEDTSRLEALEKLLKPKRRR